MITNLLQINVLVEWGGTMLILYSTNTNPFNISNTLEIKNIDVLAALVVLGVVTENCFSLSTASKPVSIRRDVKEEFLEIELLSSKTIVGNIDKEYVMQVSPNFDLKEPPHSAKRLSFLMLMLHSTSSAHFIRKMPKSFNFLESSEVGSVIFRGYSVVDESTRGQLAALLAGTSPHDFEDKPIDSLPWLFKIAKEHDYVTLISDDKTPSPMFRDVLSGFKSKPAHHYTLPFWSAANRYRIHSQQFLGGRGRVS